MTSETPSKRFMQEQGSSKNGTGPDWRKDPDSQGSAKESDGPTVQHACYDCISMSCVTRSAPIPLFEHALRNCDKVLYNLLDFASTVPRYLQLSAQ